MRRGKSRRVVLVAAMVASTAGAGSSGRISAAAPTVSVSHECTAFDVTYALWGLRSTWDVVAGDDDLELIYLNLNHVVSTVPANQQSSASATAYHGGIDRFELRTAAGVTITQWEIDPTACNSRPAFSGPAPPDPERHVEVEVDCIEVPRTGTAGRAPGTMRKARFDAVLQAGSAPLVLYSQSVKLLEVPAGEAATYGLHQHLGPEQDWYDNAFILFANAFGLGSEDFLVIQLGAEANTVVEQIPQPTCPTFVPTLPTRVLDSRPGGTTADGQFAAIGLRPAGSVTRLRVGERLGVSEAPSSVELTVTATGTVGAGYLTVWPCDEPQPLASNVTYPRRSTVANTVITAVDPIGDVCIYTLAATHLVVDLSGYDVAYDGMVTVNPARMMDTREGAATVDGLGSGIGKRSAGLVTPLQISSRGPFYEDTGPVVLAVTATDVDAPGFVTVWPCRSPRPLASNLNVGPGATVTNTVLVGAGAETGPVCLFTSAAMHLVVDAIAYNGGSHWVVAPVRLADSRPGTATVDGAEVGFGKRPAGSVTRVRVRERGPGGDDVGAAKLTVTATEPDSAGFLTVWPCSEPRPTASNLNYSSGDTVANLVSSAVDADGDVCIYTLAATHLVVDLNAVYARDPGSP